MLGFIFPTDPLTLALRYVLIMGLRALWILIGNLSITPSLWPNLLVPYEAVLFPLSFVETLSAGLPWGVVAQVTNILELVHFGLLIGAVRLLVRKFAPALAEKIPLFGTTTIGPLDGPRLQRFWWLLPLAMTYALIVFAYLIDWLLFYTKNPHRNYYRDPESWGLFQALHVMGMNPMWIGLALGVLGMVWGYRFMMGARAQVSQSDGIEVLPADHPLSLRVAGFAQKLGIPAPTVARMNQMNAFAVGGRVDDAMVIIGRPLGSVLNLQELDAIICHELGHIASGDMRAMELAEGYQRMLGKFAWFVTILAVGLAKAVSKDQTDHELTHNVGQIGRQTLFFFSELMVKGLSRSREFYADAVAAALTSPEAMASALEKVHAAPQKPDKLSTEYGYLMLKGLNFGRLFATHPSLESRCRALQDGSYLQLLARKSG